MKITKKQLAQFDKPQTMLVISPYPKKGEVYSEGVSGIASYTKNIVKELNRPVIVLADYQNKPNKYQEKNSLVLRCFQKNKISLWQELWQTLRQFKNIKNVLIQFDLSLYGSVKVSASILPFLAILKIFGYQVNVTSHSVVLDIAKLSGHVGLGNSILSKLKAKIMNLQLHTFYYLLGKINHQLIILEETLKPKLAKYINPAKIKVIAHPVDTNLRALSKQKAKQKLGIKANEQVVLFFGYVNWFKGADFFAKTFRNISKFLGKPVRFIIAGGQSATLHDKDYYQCYFSETQYLIDTSKNVDITGYVPQNKIRQYFSAADLIVFPYRAFISASGVLSLAFSYQKPFILSHELKEMLEAQDFQTALAESKLSVEDITFILDKKTLVKHTQKVLQNGVKRKMKKMGKLMSESRSYAQLAQSYEQLLFSPEQAQKLEVQGQPAIEYAYK